ncbi:prephenate dehydratase [Candidatus Woesearchaeota archaeon]|nr:prephenate dehydratase [Candidatus Woesearchaeota archaeon]
MPPLNSLNATTSLKSRDEAGSLKTADSPVRLRIATLGPEGTFSHEAALRYKSSPTLLFRKTVWDVFESVNQGMSDAGVVPLENSVSGSVGLTLDALMEFNLAIIGEILLPVKHFLAGTGNIKTITTLYTQQHTYEQCEKFIRKFLSHAEIKTTGSNADSAKSISGIDDTTVAAIVPEPAIKAYGLKEIKAEIQDNPFNTTRFIVISKKPTGMTANDRTSLAVHPHPGNGADKPGVLYGLLGSLASRNINMSKIESRPSKGKLGDYVFFIDIEGNQTEQRVKEALAEIESGMDVKILGSYPRAY